MVSLAKALPDGGLRLIEGHRADRQGDRLPSGALHIGGHHSVGFEGDTE